MKIRFRGLNKEEKENSNIEINTSSRRFLSKEHSPIFYLSYFLLFVGVCVVAALVFRLFFLIRNSTFSTSSYSIVIKSKNPFIVMLDSVSPKLSLISIPANMQNNRMKESLLLGVPIDGEIVSKEEISKDSFPNIGFLLGVVFRPWDYSYIDMTVIDAGRLIYSSFSTPASNYNIKFSKTGDIEGVSPSQLYDIFKDPTIINEQISIEIVNATSIQGLAGGAGQILKNIGCSVVSITSADEQGSSSIVARGSSVTLTRVSHVLGIVPSIDESFHGITDIRIILGQDFWDRVK